MSNNYNGWSNKATWKIVNWFNPQSLSDVKNAMYQLEAEIENASPLLKEFLKTNVNWDELEEHFFDDDIEEKDLDHYDMRKDVKGYIE